MIVYLIVIIAAVMIGIIIFRTIVFSKKTEFSNTLPSEKVNFKRFAAKLSKVVKVPTISYYNKEDIDFEKFKKFQKVLESQFPQCHRVMKKTVIKKYSVIYKWKSKNSSKKPALFLSHIDVVPVPANEKSKWKHDPFSGYIDKNNVWGRGTLDTKVTLAGVLESAELLIEQNYSPDRDIYFAFGHDEEIRGNDGAVEIVKYFQKKGISFEFALDEGGIVTSNAIPGISQNLAIIGIAEKGNLNVELNSKVSGGHASMPPASTALGKVAEAVRRLEKKQMPLRTTLPVKLFLKKIAPCMSLVNRIVIANLWIFAPVFKTIFSKTSIGNALLRTTTAMTVARAGDAINVLSTEALVKGDFRISPADSVEKVKKHIEKNVKNLDLDIKYFNCNEPSRISSADCESYRRIEKTVLSVFKDSIVAPYLVMAGTDSRHYEAVAENVYRFSPILLSKEELNRIHGIDEKVSFENLENTIKFFTLLIKMI